MPQATFRENVPQYDEDLFVPTEQPTKDMRSKLIRSKEAAGSMVVNACPYGCRIDELNEEGYCRHIVGFTDPDDSDYYFPVTPVPPIGRGDKQIQLLRERKIDGTQRKKCLNNEALEHKERGTTCFRVYHVNPPAGTYRGPRDTDRPADDAGVFPAKADLDE